MKARFPLLSATRSVRVRSASEAWSQLTKLVFHRHPRRECGTYFRFGCRRTPWGLPISLVDLLPPRPGDLSRASTIVSFSPDYISRAVKRSSFYAAAANALGNVPKIALAALGSIQLHDVTASSDACRQASDFCHRTRTVRRCCLWRNWFWSGEVRGLG